MVGASATAVRAGIMALLVLLARGTGRTYAITRALILAGFVMILHNPLILIFDSSFQLSFLATVGLIHLSPIIEKRLGFVPGQWGFREVAVSTVATQIFVLPLLLYMSGQLSVVALPVNLLILGVIPVTMFFGFLTGMIGFISTVLAMPLALVSYALLTYQLKVVELFSSFPFASFTIDYFPAWLMICFYIAIGVFLWLKKSKKELTN
jgi:competence protein ComEC